MEEQKIRQLFKNRSNCYVDTGDTDDVLLAMDEDCFVETVNEILRLHDASRRSEQLKCGNSNPPCSPNVKFGYLECTECNWSE